MKATPVPSPTSARTAIASVGSGAARSSPLPDAMTSRATSATGKAPWRSARRPPGICTRAWTKKSDVVKSPTTPRPIPYAFASGSATAPTLVMFQPTARPTSAPPSVARRALIVEDSPFHPARDEDDVARDVARELVGGEHHDLPRHVLGLGCLPEGHRPRRPLEHARVVERRARHRRDRPPGTDGVDACPGGDPHDLVLEAQQETTHDRRLRGRIVGVPRLAEEALGLFLLRQVGLEERRAFQLRTERLRPLAPTVPVERERGALGGEGAGARRADPAGGARDEHPLPVQPGVHDQRPARPCPPQPWRLQSGAMLRPRSATYWKIRGPPASLPGLLFARQRRSNMTRRRTGAMFSLCRLGLTGDLDRSEVRAAWIAWARLAAVPFVFLEVAIESGNYPPGDEAYAWTLAAAFAAGALVLLRFRERAAPGLMFDWAAVSLWVALYSFEPGTPVRQLLLVPVVEAALRYGVRGGALMPLASLPALAFFEWRQAIRRDLHPFDAGHVVGPAGVGLLVGLVIGGLVRRSEARARSSTSH